MFSKVFRQKSKSQHSSSFEVLVLILINIYKIYLITLTFRKSDHWYELFSVTIIFRKTFLSHSESLTWPLMWADPDMLSVWWPRHNWVATQDSPVLERLRRARTGETQAQVARSAHARIFTHMAAAQQCQDTIREDIYYAGRRKYKLYIHVLLVLASELLDLLLRGRGSEKQIADNFIKKSMNAGENRVG